MTPDDFPASQPVPIVARAGALTVDLEEWYHNCWTAEYLDPATRPILPEELDRLLPDMLAFFAAVGARATFFVLGEVARRLPARVREIAAAGHEVACHGDLHLRANSRPALEFAADIRRARALLEDLIGDQVRGFRAPEWSLRSARNPLLRRVVEAGFAYDSSLAPWPGAGERSNPVLPSRFRWPDGSELMEVPPLAFGGRLRLPAGGWTGRIGPTRLVMSAARDLARQGGLPLLVVHPWELVDRDLPGLLTGFARFFHDAGRRGFRDRLADRLRRWRWQPIRDHLAAPVAAAEPAPASCERSVA
ncbi:MAG: polysaccharide deacetylase family protein [Thermoanaerobaculia bacterium]